MIVRCFRAAHLLPHLLDLTWATSRGIGLRRVKAHGSAANNAKTSRRTAFSRRITYTAAHVTRHASPRRSPQAENDRVRQGTRLKQEKQDDGDHPGEGDGGRETIAHVGEQTLLHVLQFQTRADDEDLIWGMIKRDGGLPSIFFRYACREFVLL
jgi:hypothetical protein